MPLTSTVTPRRSSAVDELGDDLGAGRVEDLQLRHPDDDDLDVPDVADALEHALGRAEEQGALEPEQRDALVAGLGGHGQLLAVHAARAGERAQGEERGDGDADEHGVDEVEAHRDDRGDDEDDRVGAASTR